MFAGIGGFRAGLTRAGGFQCVGHCEIDRHADASYRAIHDVREEERYDPDARTIDPNDLPNFDLLCGGFPCQAFSLAGKKRGFADARGALFFEITRLAEAKRPSYLLLENVPGLLSHDGGRTFAAILTTLSDLGYHVEWAVLNSADFQVPQSRKRVFLICYLDPRCAGKILPVFGTGGKALVQVLGGPQGSRVYHPEGVACTQTAGAGGMGGKTGLYLLPPQGASFVDLCVGKPRRTELARCLTARYGQTTLSNHWGERSGVLLIQEATKKGYKEAGPGDTVDLGYVGSATRAGRVSRYCQKVREPMLEKARKLSAEETRDLTQLEAIWYEGSRYEKSSHYNDTRYYALNLHSVFYRGTVEFRCFNSTLHAGRAAAYINLCLAMSAQAVNQRSTVMRKTHSDNELFTFRVWLVRLGLNGPEFKHTRDHLLANLEGDRAWRYDKDSYEVNRKKKRQREMER